MTDTTLEPTQFCAGCGTLVAVRLADIHKRQGCTARLANTLRQYRESHGGVHASIDDTVDSFDKDIDAIIARVKTLENASETGGQAGITVTADLDVPDYADELDETVPPARHPLTDVNAPRGINPLTGLPE